jgi:hypothetical protein
VLPAGAVVSPPIPRGYQAGQTHVCEGNKGAISGPSSSAERPPARHFPYPPLDSRTTDIPEASYREGWHAKPAEKPWEETESLEEASVDAVLERVYEKLAWARPVPGFWRKWSAQMKDDEELVAITLSSGIRCAEGCHDRRKEADALRRRKEAKLVHWLREGDKVRLHGLKEQEECWEAVVWEGGPNLLLAVPGVVEDVEYLGKVDYRDPEARRGPAGRLMREVRIEEEEERVGVLFDLRTISMDGCLEQSYGLAKLDQEAWRLWSDGLIRHGDVVWMDRVELKPSAMSQPYAVASGVRLIGSAKEWVDEGLNAATLAGPELKDWRLVKECPKVPFGKVRERFVRKLSTALVCCHFERRAEIYRTLPLWVVEVDMDISATDKTSIIDFSYWD